MDPASAQRRASCRSSFGLRRLAAAGVVVTVVVLLLWIAWRLAWAEPLDAQASSLQGELDRQLELLAWQRWRRPVHHGSVREGNAAVAARAQLLRGRELEILASEIESSLVRGFPSPSVRKLARRHGPQLERLRKTTELGQAWLAEPNLARSGSVPDDLAHLRSVELLLVAALDGPADECLRMAADAVRLAQDLVPGGGLARLSFAAVEVRHAVSVTVRCAHSATEGALEYARRAFESLAANCPPVGPALQAEALLNAVALRAHYELRPPLPEFWKPPNERARSDPRRLLEAWQFELAMANAAQSFQGSPLTEVLRQAAAWEAKRRAASNPLIRQPPTATNATVSVLRALEARAHIVLAASLLAVVAGTPRRLQPQSWDSKLALRPHLRDPFTGSPLRQRSGVSPGGFVLYSVGPNRQDDAAGSDDIAVRWAPRSTPEDRSVSEQ